MSSQNFLPYGRQTIDDADIDAVVDVLRGDYLTTGPTAAAFETAFAEQVEAPHAIVVSSGTAALHLAALALNLGPDDCVIVPTITFLATANAIRLTGADVVFADVDPETALLSPACFEAAIDQARTKSVSAVFPVHMNGQPCDMDALGAIAARHGIEIVEDACHALGGTIGDQPVGNGLKSRMTMFSLHPVKAIAMGEGGVLTTADDSFDKRLRDLRNHGIVRDPDRFTNTSAALDASGEPHSWYYEMQEPGLNYRASDIHCALGLSQLYKLEKFHARRTRLADLYDDALRTLAPVLKPASRVAWGRSGWHLYPVLINYEAAGLTRDNTMAALRSRGIGSQVHYFPVHRQPYYERRYGKTVLPGAEAYFARCLSLPLFPSMTDDDIQRVAQGLSEVLGTA